MNNIGKLLSNLTKMKREKTQISKIRTKKRGEKNTKKSRESSGTTYFENLHLNELENLEEMDKFLDTYDHPKLNQENVNHINRSITCNEFEASIKSLSKKRKVWDLTDSQLNSTRPLTNSFQYSLNFSMKQKRKEHCLTHFMKPLLHSSQSQTRRHQKRRTTGQFP
jgi:hypothetical protein